MRFSTLVESDITFGSDILPRQSDIFTQMRKSCGNIKIIIYIGNFSQREKYHLRFCEQISLSDIVRNYHLTDGQISLFAAAKKLQLYFCNRVID